MKKCKSGYYWCYTDKSAKKFHWDGTLDVVELLRRMRKRRMEITRMALEMGMGGLMGRLMAEASQKKQSLVSTKILRNGPCSPKRESKHRRRCSKAAASMKKKDVKDFASTKHKGLPEKKKVEEAYYGGEEQRKKDEKQHTKNN